MTRSARIALRLTTAILLLLALVVIWPAPDALAHGGRIFPKPPTPGGGGPPPRPKPKPSPRPPPPPPPTTPPPTTGGSVPMPTTPSPQGPGPTTPGSTPSPTTPAGTGYGRGRTAAQSSPEMRWEMWWALNRWSFFPDRGFTGRADAVTTPASADAPDPAALERARRALIRRQDIVPFMLEALDPARDVRDEVRAAALIGIARQTHDEAAVRRILAFAGDAKSSNLVRESAAYALGMLRRRNPEAQMDGVRLDRLRGHLLDLLDDEGAPVRTRAFAAFSIGMLGDQPYGSAFTKDGRVVQRALWERAIRKHRNRDIPVAIFTALGLHPAAGASDEIGEGLRRIALGRRVGRRSWDSTERSHALTALVRQRGPGWAMLLMRIVEDKRLPTPVQRAAFIAIGAQGVDLDAEQRRDAADSVDRGLRRARDPLTKGLAQIALGRLVQADLAAGSPALVERTPAATRLLGEARHGSLAYRGFSAIALALALRDTNAKSNAVTKFTADGLTVLQQGFERERESRMRSAYAVALGLLGKAAHPALPGLTAVLADRNADPSLRGYVALALAQIGPDHTGGVRKALRVALWDKRSVDLRSQAALALSFIGGSAETKMLIGELGKAHSQWVLAQVAAALGQLGDVDAVPAILELAVDEKRTDEARALAIASLGLIGDPQPKPSSLRLTLDANYPARTNALAEVFTIL